MSTPAEGFEAAPPPAPSKMWKVSLPPKNKAGYPPMTLAAPTAAAAAAAYVAKLKLKPWIAEQLVVAPA